MIEDIKIQGTDQKQKVVYKNQTSSKRKDTFFYVTLIYLILMISFIIVRILSSLNVLSFLGEFSSTAYTILIQIVIMFILPIILYKFFCKKSLKEVFADFKFKKINYKSVFIAVAIGVLVYILNIAISSFFSLIISLLGYEQISLGTSSTSEYTLGAFFATLVTTALLPGFCEEIASRGMLLKGFENLGVKKMIIFSGLLFGLMHLNIEQFFYASIIGCFLSFICIATGNIIPGMIIHFMNNGLSTYMSFAQVNDWPLGDVISNLTYQSGTTPYFTSVLIIFLILLLACFLLIWLVYLLIQQTTGRKIKKLTSDLTKTIMDEQKEELQAKGVKYVNIHLPQNILGFTSTQKYWPPLRHKIFLYSTFFIGGVITLFTLIWGVL